MRRKPTPQVRWTGIVAFAVLIFGGASITSFGDFIGAPLNVMVLMLLGLIAACAYLSAVSETLTFAMWHPVTVTAVDYEIKPAREVSEWNQFDNRFYKTIVAPYRVLGEYQHPNGQRVQCVPDFRAKFSTPEKVTEYLSQTLSQDGSVQALVHPDFPTFVQVREYTPPSMKKNQHSELLCVRRGDIIRCVFDRW